MEIKTIVVFDFDGTITQKDTLLEFIKFSKGNTQFYFGFLLFSPLLIAMKLRIYPNWKVKQQLFSYFYKGTPLNEFNNWGKNFIKQIEKTVRLNAYKALKSHREKGHKVVVISASIENWIKPWAEKMEIDNVLATKIETDDNGIITGKFLTKNCYGSEKALRLIGAFPNRNEYRLIAYGDSRGDKELLELADERFYKKL